MRLPFLTTQEKTEKKGKVTTISQVTTTVLLKGANEASLGQAYTVELYFPFLPAFQLDD